MLNDRNPRWVYTQTIKMFAAPASPPFEDELELERHWGRAWGLDNDVGQIRSILVHRPGPEMAIVDPAKRIPEIGSFGDVESGWYFQSETPPDVPAMQAEHDALVAALKAAGIEVFHAEGVDGGRLKSCYTRDPLIMVRGGAIVCRMGARIRRGEELAITRTLAKIGVPILRTISGTGVMEGGSFAWINSSTAAIGVGVRVNRDGALQVAEVLKRQGVELLIVDLTGYDIHLDVSFLMVDKDLALVNPFGLPYSFMEELKARGIHLVEIDPTRRSLDQQLPGDRPRTAPDAGGRDQPHARRACSARGYLDHRPLRRDAQERRRHPLLDNAAAAGHNLKPLVRPQPKTLGRQSPSRRQNWLPFSAAAAQDLPTAAPDIKSKLTTSIPSGGRTKSSCYGAWIFVEIRVSLSYRRGKAEPAISSALRPAQSSCRIRESPRCWASSSAALAAS